MMELFATSARPSEMLWGKLLGLGALGLTQIVIWAIIALILGTLQGSVNVERLLATYQITPGFLAVLLVFFILGYFVFGTLMSAFGVMVNAEQEGRQISSIISIVAIAPYFFIMQYLQSPNEGIAQFLSLFPLTSPVGMILRISWANVPPGEILLAIVLLVLTVIGLIWFAARMLRLGMLNYGKKLSLREILQALVEGRQVITSREKKEAEVGA
jgi:ABC-2 type transport system permease protein